MRLSARGDEWSRLCSILLCCAVRVHVDSQGINKTTCDSTVSIFYFYLRRLSDASDAILVNALFGLIPLLLDRIGSPDIVEGEGRLECGVVSVESRKPSVFPAATTWPPTVPPTALNANICESSLGFDSSIFPFWNGGRWQVAVFRSVGTRLLIDPWGLDGSRDPHVRRNSWDVF